MKLNLALEKILSLAYEPCPEFTQACLKMRWNPQAGHVPRGFLGACGQISEVEMVLVFAEPGDPHIGESHSGLQSAYVYATFAFRTGKDLFHRNVRKILDLCWPNMPFEEQMSKVWLTDSVLCSAPKEGGHVSRAVSLACGHRYLVDQLALFSNPLIVAVGSKAQSRLRALGVQEFMSVYAAAPPGCNMPEAIQSWQQIPIELERRREGLPNTASETSPARSAPHLEH